jgi:hypothetical protein
VPVKGFSWKTYGYLKHTKPFSSISGKIPLYFELFLPNRFKSVELDAGFPVNAAVPDAQSII